MKNDVPVVSADRAERGRYRVVSIDGGVGLTKKLARLGIFPGSSLEVLSSPGRRGPIRLSVMGSHFGLGRGMASRIMVNRAGPWQIGKKTYTLRDYKEGQKGVILEVMGAGKFKKRITEMGFLRGAVLFVEKYAPLRDPIEIVIKGYHLSLRRSEADFIVMSEPEG
jgi:Fe2+ transport system protein FeoA